jgi:hypothetical protein
MKFIGAAAGLHIFRGLIKRFGAKAIFKVVSKAFGSKTMWRTVARGAGQLFLATLAMTWSAARVVSGFAFASLHAAFRTAGTMSGMLFSGAWRVAATAGVVAAKLVAVVGGLAWRASGLAAGAAWAAGFRMTSTLGGVGSSIAASLGGSLIGRIGASAARWGIAGLRFVGKGLLRAVPFVGWGLIAYEVGSLLWSSFGPELKAFAKRVGDWFQQNMPEVFRIGQAVFSVISEGLSAIRSLFSGGFDSVVGAVSAAGVHIYIAARQAGVRALDGISGVLSGIGSAVIDAIKAAINFVMERIEATVEGFKSVGEAIAGAITAPLDKIAGAVQKAIDAARAGIDSLTGGEADETDPTKANPRSGLRRPKVPFAPLPGGSLDDIRAPSRMMFEESTLKSPDPGLKPLNTQKAPPSFAESGVRPEKSSSLDARLASIETLLASGKVKADVETKGKVDINIKTAPGVRATGISTSNGDVDLSLNVGTDSLSAG